MSAEPDEVTAKRRMPESLRKYLLKMQGGKFYLPAAYRIVWFRDECPDWTIETDLVEGGQEAGFATVKATVKNEEGRVIATGHKTETRQDFPAGWTEKAETGSVARALALAGFGTQFTQDLDTVVDTTTGEVSERGTQAKPAHAPSVSQDDARGAQNGTQGQDTAEEAARKAALDALKAEAARIGVNTRAKGWLPPIIEHLAVSGFDLVGKLLETPAGNWQTKDIQRLVKAMLAYDGIPGADPLPGKATRETVAEAV